MASLNPYADNTLADIRECIMGDRLTEAEKLLARIHHDDMTETLFKDISAAVGCAIAHPAFDPDLLDWTEERVEEEKAKALAAMDCSFEVFKNALELRDYENEEYWSAMVDVRTAYTRFTSAPRHVRDRLNDELVEHMVRAEVLPALADILSEQLTAGFQHFRGCGEFPRELCRVCYKTLAFFFYFSDTSAVFARAVTEEGCSLLASISTMLDRFKVPFFVGRMRKELQEMLFVGLALSYNLVMHDDSPTIIRIRHMNLMASVRPYLYSTEERFKVLPLLFMLYVADESEYCSNPSVIKYLVDQLMLAADSKEKSAAGYKIWELMRAIEKLAALDVNKQVLYEMGTVEKMKQLLLSCDEAEMTGALHILTQLAFDKEVAESIREEVVEFTADQLLRHENEDVQKAATSMMWVVQEKLGRGRRRRYRRDDAASLGFRSLRRQPSRPAAEEAQPVEELETDSVVLVSLPPDQQHVMISYNWESQARVVQIKEYLEQQGFRVWFDTEKMGRNLLDSMADAVEGAWVVLVCYSRKYKLSRNCRSEAEYASKLLKPIVPVQMEAYEPDGWLGLLVGRLFVHDYCETTDDANFQLFTSLTRLRHSLARGEQASLTDDPSATVVSAPGNPRFSDATGRDLAFLAEWSEPELAAWFERHGIRRSEFGFVTGKELRLLIRMRKESPNAFYRFLTKKVALADLAAFVEALDSL